MKSSSGNFIVGLFVVFALAACSRQPVQEINAAKSAVDAAMADGAEKYSPAEARRVNDELAVAIAEVSVQDNKLWKDYKKSQGMLAEVKSNAEALRAGLPAKKQVAKREALAALETTTSLVREVRTSLSKAELGRKEKGTLDALEVDAKELDGDLLELKNLIDTEDYTTAIEKATAAEKGAAALSEKVRLASATKAPKKGGTSKRRS
jgi:hypothetical protein